MIEPVAGAVIRPSTVHSGYRRPGDRTADHAVAVVTSWLGATTATALDAASFLISAVLLRRLRTSEREPPRRPTGHHRARDITAGWRYILGHCGLAALFWNSVIFGGCIMALVPLLALFVLRDLGLPAWQYGLIGGVSGVVGILGSLLTKPAAKRFGEHGLLLLAGIGRNLWLGLIPLATASTSGFIMITASEFLLAFFAGKFSPTFATYRMNTTGDEHTSRVVMAWSITNKTVQPVFIAADGFHAAITSARISLIVLAVVLLPGFASPLAGRRLGKGEVTAVAIGRSQISA